MEGVWVANVAVTEAAPWTVSARVELVASRAATAEGDVRAAVTAAIEPGWVKVIVVET